MFKNLFKKSNEDLTPNKEDDTLNQENIAPLVPKRKQRKLKLPLIIAIVLVVVVGGFLGYKFVFGKNAQTALTTAKVTKGDINVTITGSGTIEPNEQYNITSLVKGEIIDAPFEEGQTVNKGDLLYKINTKDLENNIEKQKLSVEKAQLTYNKTIDDESKLTVTSTYTGTITNLYVKVGDKVSANGKIADLVDSNTMILSVPFISDDANNISSGSLANITMSDTYQSLSGTVRRVASGEAVSASGIPVKTVEIAVSNPGSIKQGDRATAVVGNIACNDLGKFDYNEQTTIQSETEGKVQSLPYHLGDNIKSGNIIAKLTNDSNSNTNEQNSIAVKDAQLNLQNQYDQMGDYNIKSPINGTILQKTSKLGDNLDNSNSTTVMAVVADMSKILFKMNIDELDIDKIKQNQEVKITADALPDRNFTGYVDNISVVGTTTNGVTTYPVTVVVNNPEGLIPGMNVNAEIVVQSKQDVLRVPVAAVNRGNFVIVKSDAKNGGNKQNANASFGKRQNADNANASGGDNQAANPSGNRSQAANNMKSAIPEGYKMVKVETGLSDSNFIEITSGLNEGDAVLLPTVKSSTSSQTNMMMGGGMPGGGFSGGGNYRNNTGNRTTNSSSSTNRSTSSGSTSGSNGSSNRSSSSSGGASR